MDADHLVVIGDARKMKELPGESVQLIVTSPPHLNFRVGGPEGNGYLTDFDAYLRGLLNVFKECRRVLQNGRFLCLNICDSASNMEKMPIPAHLLFALRRSGFRFCEDIFWTISKQNGSKENGRQTGLFVTDARILPDFQVQRTLIFCKGAPKRSSILKDNMGWDALDEALSFQNLPVQYTRANESNPDLFSEELVEALVLHFTTEGDTILDPFLGNGTLSRVAAQLHRHSVGYESNPYNLRIIRQKAGIPDGRLKLVFQGEGRLT